MGYSDATLLRYPPESISAACWSPLSAVRAMRLRFNCATVWPQTHLLAFTSDDQSRRALSRAGYVGLNPTLGRHLPPASYCTPVTCARAGVTKRRRIRRQSSRATADTNKQHELPHQT